MKLEHKIDFNLTVPFVLHFYGIDSYENHAPYAWEMAHEGGNVLLFEAEMIDPLASQFDSLVTEMQEKINGLSWEASANNVLYFLLGKMVREAVIKVSTSDMLWDKIGGVATFNRYFSNFPHEKHELSP